MNKKGFKVIFISPFSVLDINDDNCDINIVLDSGEVYFGILMTVSNVTTLTQKEDYPGYVDMEDTIVINKMEENLIRNALSYIVSNDYLDSTFSKIGMLNRDYNIDYEELIDFSTWWGKR